MDGDTSEVLFYCHIFYLQALTLFCNVYRRTGTFPATGMLREDEEIGILWLQPLNFFGKKYERHALRNFLGILMRLAALKSRQNIFFIY